MASPEGPEQHEPVKQRVEPTPCRDCGRVNWSSEGRCVYCRLDWPDPEELRTLRAAGHQAGSASLPQPSPSAAGVDPSTGLRFMRARPDIEVDVAGRFIQDLLCTNCRYNLRGMREEDQCPECGSSVARSRWVHQFVLPIPAGCKVTESRASFCRLVCSGRSVGW